MDYLFVCSDNNWWLKINTLEELLNYHKQTEYRWQRAFKDFEQVLSGRHHTDSLSNHIDMLAALHNTSFLKEMINLAETTLKNQKELLEKNGCLYFNSVGGCFFGEISYSQFLRKPELLFPSFEEKDIRIKKWENGKHFYAYIGDLQLKDGDILKWDTETEARDFAKKYINKN